jgi:proteasome component ECM29
VIALREAKRNNDRYRPHGLNALGGFAEVRTDLNLVPDALGIVAPFVEEAVSPSDDKMDIDSGNLTKISE